MTTEFVLDISRILESFQDRNALELVQRVIKAETVLHESRLGQLKELSQALDKRVTQLGGQAKPK